MRPLVRSIALLSVAAAAPAWALVAMDLSPLRAADLDGLRFDAVSTCYIPLATEVHILATRAWVTGDSMRFVIGSIDPDWRANSFPIFPLGFALTMTPERFRGTAWGTPEFVSFEGVGLLPNPFPNRSANVGLEGDLREMLGNILGAAVPDGLAVAAAWTMQAGDAYSPWSTDGTGKRIRVSIDDGRLSRLEVRQEHGGSTRRFDYAYTTDTPPQLDRIDFCFGPDQTLLPTVPIVPGQRAETVAAQNGGMVDRHFGGWSGTVDFAPQMIEETQRTLPVTIEVKLAATGATLYTSRIFGYCHIPKEMPAADLDEQLRAYGFPGALTKEIFPHVDTYYLRPAAEVSAADRAILLDAVGRSAERAAKSDSPADDFFAMHLALQAAILLSDNDSVVPRFEAYLAHMAENATPRAVRECGVETLRYVLRRGDFPIYELLLPVFRRHLKVEGDLHLACYDASDYASSDRHWASLEIVAAALAMPDLDAQWRFRFLALEAWNDWQLSTPDSRWFAHLINWGNVPPALFEVPQPERRNRATEKVRRAMAVFDAIRVTAENFDRQMRGELEGFLDPSLGYRTAIQHKVSDGVVTVPSVVLHDSPPAQP